MRVSELIEIFPVTAATIRRDLVKLENEGKVVRRRGEVRLGEKLNNLLVPSFFQRTEIQSEEKSLIAKAAVALIKDNQSIIMDSGTTTLALAKELSRYQNLTIITNSIPISYVFTNKEIEVRLSGGILHKENLSLIGPEADNYFKNIQVDICFIGSSGVRKASGLTTGSPFECSIKQSMSLAAKQVVALIDSSKFDSLSIIEFIKFENIDKIITTNNVKDIETLKYLNDLGVDVVFA